MFGGIRCAKHQPTGILPRIILSIHLCILHLDEGIYVSHKVGTALIHLGRHRHLAQPIQSGRRVNLILWFTSSHFFPLPHLRCRSSMYRKLSTYLQCEETCGLNSVNLQKHHNDECDCGDFKAHLPDSIRHQYESSSDSEGNSRDDLEVDDKLDYEAEDVQ